MPPSPTLDLDFRAGGNGPAALGEGWSVTEPLGTWMLGEASSLNLPPAMHGGAHRLSLELVAMLIPPVVPAQLLTVRLNGAELYQCEVTSDGVTRLICEIAPGRLRADGPNALLFHHPDAAAPADFLGVGDGRTLSFRLLALRLEAAGAFVPSSNPTSGSASPGSTPFRPFFLMTGVVLPGEAPNLEFARFLQGEDAGQLAWLDFKADEDFLRAREQGAGIADLHFGRAPRAMWAGPSTVTAILEGLAAALALPDPWTQIVICSNRDVPLLPRAALRAALEALGGFDYCGSRWNRATEDIWIPERIPTAPRLAMDTDHRLHQARREMAVRAEAALAPVCSDEAIRSLRFADTLPDRFAFAASESYIGMPTLSLHRMTPQRVAEKTAFFRHFSLIAGRLWCAMSRRFAELLVTPMMMDVFTQAFADIAMVDECFFQSVADTLSRQGLIRAHWQPLYRGDAQVLALGPEEYRHTIAHREPHELFARKEFGLRDYAGYFG